MMVSLLAVGSFGCFQEVDQEHGRFGQRLAHLNLAPLIQDWMASCAL
jgi:hypothetical protein